MNVAASAVSRITMPRLAFPSAAMSETGAHTSQATIDTARMDRTAAALSRPWSRSWSFPAT